MRVVDKKGLNSYLFSLDVLIEGESNAQALEQLLHVLNHSGLSDFRINEGIELGRVIEKLEQQQMGAQLSKADGASLYAGPARRIAQTIIHPPDDEPRAAAAAERGDDHQPYISERIHSCIKANRLIRLTVNKGRGVKLSIPCRIINFDEVQMVVTVYHVDEKQVYAFSINEIDDFIE
ncbi:hypothetical protein IDH44_23840 [Paenibacillus sp. IB182496]|uniref:Uncharacterized protein n=1 Tax=Paenibacillus sabuli TaxID=2772509 RepID=A0A927GU29_9BACL|nr:hypothetical protein [Paenibacillus sabuli]MBD2848238.1 hypothetical protein [Paenibacillus sabuli]